MQTSQTTGQSITSGGLRATWQLTDNHRLKTYKSQCQNSSKFLSFSYLMKTADVIMNLFSSHNTTDHT